MQGCKARAQEDVPVLEVLLGGGSPLRQSSGHHLGAGAVVPNFQQHLLPAIRLSYNDCYQAIACCVASVVGGIYNNNDSNELHVCPAMLGT